MRFINQNSSKTAFKVDIPLRSVLANAHTKSHYSTCKWTIVGTFGFAHTAALD